MTFTDRWPSNPGQSCQVPNFVGLLDEYIEFKTDGRFVECGGYNGLDYSNTYNLAELGWRGIVIEPSNEAFDANLKLRQTRSHKVSVYKTAVSNYTGETTLYLGNTLSTIVREQRDQYNQLAWAGTSDLSKGKTQRTRVTTLDDLLEQANWEPEFDLLSLDVEGSEYHVLEEFNIEYWLPTLCVVETHALNEDLDLSIMTPVIDHYFERHGYDLVYEDIINSVYVRRSEDVNEDSPDEIETHESSL